MQQKKNGCFHYSWLVVVGCFISHFIILGIAQTFGIMYSELLVYFNSGKGETTWVASINSGICFGVGPLAGILVRKRGCHVVTFIGTIIGATGMALSMLVPEIHFLYLTYGLITGVGSGFLHHVQHTVVQYYFTYRRSMATAIASIGGGIGTVVLPVLTHFCIDHLEWRGTFLILSGLALNTLICACLYWIAARRKAAETRKTQRECSQKEIEAGCAVQKGNNVAEKTEIKETSVAEDFKEVARNFRFVVFTISAALITLVCYIPYVILPDYVRAKGFPKHDCALLITTAGVSGIVGRLLTGLVSDGFPHSRLLIHGVTMTVGGVMTIVCTLMTSYAMFAVYASVLGIFTGSMSIFISVICMDLVGKRLLSVAFGLQTCFQSVFLIVGPPIGGWIADMSQSYDGTFYYCGVMFTLSGFISIIVQYMKSEKEVLHEKVVFKDGSCKLKQNDFVYYVDCPMDMTVKNGGKDNQEKNSSEVN